MKGEVLSGVGLHMARADNVVTAITDLEPGMEIATDETTIEITETVPFGHKVALEPLQPGETVVKYGEPIGTAVESIDPGEWIHTHNCESARGRGDRTEREEGA